MNLNHVVVQNEQFEFKWTKLPIKGLDCIGRNNTLTEKVWFIVGTLGPSLSPVKFTDCKSKPKKRRIFFIIKASP